MRKIISFTLLCCFIFLARCQETTKYDSEDVAAIIRGEELTVGELCFLYLNDQILDHLEGTIKGKQANQLLDDLYEDNLDEIEILIR